MRTERDARESPAAGDDWREPDSAGGRAITVMGTFFDYSTLRKAVIYRISPDFWDRTCSLDTFKRKIRKAKNIHIAQEGGAE